MVNEDEGSPRTSAGISKSFLTPIRRIGLSRKRRTPMLSPLISTQQSQVVILTPPVTAEKMIPKDDGSESLNGTNLIDVTTPARKLGLHRRQNKKLTPNRNDFPRTLQKSESLCPEIVMECDDVIDNLVPRTNNLVEQPSKKLAQKKSPITVTEDINLSLEVSFGEKHINDSEVESVGASSCTTPEKMVVTIPNKKGSKNTTPKSDMAGPSRKKSKQKTPKRLRKHKSGDLNLKHKCIVVIDEHVLNRSSISFLSNVPSKETHQDSSNKLVRESIKCDSDYDDIPLSEISNKLNITKENDKKSFHKSFQERFDDDPDLSFENPVQEMKFPVTKVTKLSKDKMTISSTKNSDTKTKERNIKTIRNLITLSDSDDDDFESKKTILVQKTYPKPLNRAKSTGSITQKDIDDIRACIKNKKNELLIKSCGHNIAELMDLIKKWRRGCQDALMELLDIVRIKVPEKQFMKTGELLKMLNIPMELVEYNAEEDCFLSPEI